MRCIQHNCVIPSLSVMSTDAVLGYLRVTLSEADIIATENDSMDSTMLSSVMEMVRHCVEPVAAIGPSETDTGSDTPKSPGEREGEQVECNNQLVEREGEGGRASRV